jgi:hypothetical protein
VVEAEKVTELRAFTVFNLFLQADERVLQTSDSALCGGLQRHYRKLPRWGCLKYSIILLTRVSIAAS